jgi:hypothetical protein
MYDAGKRFLFLINKIENNTLHITQLLVENATANAASGGSFIQPGHPIEKYQASSSFSITFNFLFSKPFLLP